jgi:hypothetical protein
MAIGIDLTISDQELRVSTDARAARTIPIVTLGLALSAFFAVSYLICVLGYLLLPEFAIQHAALSTILPGFTLLSWPSFFLGLAESLLWGWYIALMFGSIYNFVARRR